MAPQTVTEVGTEAAGLVIWHPDRKLIALHTQRTDASSHLEAIVEVHPLHPVLASLPGVAVRTAAICIPETSGKSFDSAATMAPYAGLVPSTSQSDTSSKSEGVSSPGNNRLKRALFPSPFASIRFDSSCWDHNGRKELKASVTTKSLIVLARRGPRLLFAMIRDGSIHDAPLVKADRQNT